MSKKVEMPKDVADADKIVKEWSRDQTKTYSGPDYHRKDK